MLRTWRRQIAGHLVDGLGELLPDARRALDLSLATKLTLSADLAGHTGDLRGEDRQLLGHRVHKLCRAEELAFERTSIHLKFHRLPKVTLGDRANGPRNLICRSDQVIQQSVEAINFGGPPANRARSRHALLEPPFLANRPPQPCQLTRESVLVRDGLVEGRGDLALYSAPIRLQSHGKIAITKCNHRCEHPLRPGSRGTVLRCPVRWAGAITPQLARRHDYPSFATPRRRILGVFLLQTNLISIRSFARDLLNFIL